MTQTTRLHAVRTEKIYGSSLLRLASHFEYVHDTERVTNLAEVFQERPDLMAVGVCRLDGTVRGLVTRVHLYSLLGKPFGREVLSRKPVADIVETAASFSVNLNLFVASESLQASMDKSTVQYYLLTDDNGQFKGIFSSKDLLAYLSRMTQEDIHLAGQLQERLVQGRLSQAGDGWEVEAFSQSAKGLGGDFYHVLPWGQGQLFLALGDVSGKGVAASVLTSMLWGVLQFYDYAQGLKRLLVQLNVALIQTFHLEKYLTGFFALYDPSTRNLTLADMGHGHGWLLRQGKARQLRFPGGDGGDRLNLPLGIDPALAPKVHRTRLHPGDLVVFYTDGLTEQENAAGEELGEEAVIRLAARSAADPGRLPETVADLLAGHQGGVPRLDDVTWLQLRVD